MGVTFASLLIPMYILIKTFKITVKKSYFNHTFPPVTLFQYFLYSRRQPGNYMAESVHLHNNFAWPNYTNIMNRNPIKYYCSIFYFLKPPLKLGFEHSPTCHDCNIIVSLPTFFYFGISLFMVILEVTV